MGLKREEAKEKPHKLKSLLQVVVLSVLLHVPGRMRHKEDFIMATMQDIISSPLLLIMVIIGLVYIAGFSLVYGMKAYKRCLELGFTKEQLMRTIKSTAIFSIVPSLAIVVGLFVLIVSLGTVWSWWRLSVIGSLSYETLIAGSLATTLGYTSSSEMMSLASGREFGVVMILMSIGMLSGFFILLPFGRKLSTSVSKDEGQQKKKGSTWSYVLSNCFMMCLFAVYVPLLLFSDSTQCAVMLTGTVVAILIGVIASKFKVKWLGDFTMAFSMIAGLVSSVFWASLFGA